MITGAAAVREEIRTLATRINGEKESFPTITQELMENIRPAKVRERAETDWVEEVCTWKRFEMALTRAGADVRGGRREGGGEGRRRRGSQEERGGEEEKEDWQGRGEAGRGGSGAGSRRRGPEGVPKAHSARGLVNINIIYQYYSLT